MDQADRLRDMFQYKTVSPSGAAYLSSRVITITSGKGGVGKTNFAVNLAINLKRRGKRVVIMDADFGLANIEVLFGIIPRFSLADVLFGGKSINDVITNGPLGIPFVSAGSGLRELANINEKQMDFLIENFNYLDSISDIILIDTGAGISKSVINFIKASTETVIVTTPEPTSITDAYALIKTIKEEESGIPEFKIVVNRVDDFEEGKEVFEKLNRVATRFLGIGLTSLGYIPYDNNLIKAVKRQQPVSLSFPNTIFSKAMESISLKLLDIKPEQNSSEHVGLMSFMKRLANIFSS